MTVYSSLQVSLELAVSQIALIQLSNDGDLGNREGGSILYSNVGKAVS